MINDKEKCGFGCGRKWDENGQPNTGFDDCPSSYHIPVVQKPAVQPEMIVGKTTVQPKGIKSPYSKDLLVTKFITKEQLEQVRSILGFRQLFIVASNRSSKSSIKDVICTGIGFPPSILK